MISRILAGGILFLGLACQGERTAQVKEAVQHNADEDLPPFSCNPGEEAAPFVFFPLAAQPDRQDLKLPAGGDTAVVVVPDAENNLRLDLCVKDDQVKLKRLVSIRNHLLEVSTIPTGSRVEGLKDAVLRQDYSQLSIDIPLEELQKVGEVSSQPTDERMKIVGRQNAAGGFAVAYNVGPSGSGEKISDRGGARALVGKLDYGDFNAIACVGGWAAQGAFKLGTALFEWEGCQYMSTSGGIAPEIRTFVITDSAAQLPASIRNKPFEVSVTSNPDYEYLNNHHSVCDSFSLKLSHATYGVTASSGMGGGTDGVDLPNPVVRDAPECRTVTRYRYRYGSSTTWVTGDAPPSCTHFSRNCPQN